eukprot:scaffold47970_cov67-Phaeocystis_antarctica.AAC.2
MEDGRERGEHPTLDAARRRALLLHLHQHRQLRILQAAHLLQQVQLRPGALQLPPQLLSLPSADVNVERARGAARSIERPGGRPPAGGRAFGHGSRSWWATQV